MRVTHLDGMRGIAIILVVLFHAYAGWPEQVPYGDAYTEIAVFKFGWLGVELFFLVSGFVISVSLEKTTTFTVFMYKRWLKLFPAMLVATILIYATLGVFYERPNGIPDSFLSALPGLLFMDWWPKLVNMEVLPLEVAFWTLYIEFKFYVIAGVTYFFLGRQYLTPILVFLFVFWVITYTLNTQFDLRIIQLFSGINEALSLKYFGWFAAGSTYYRYYQTANFKWLITTLLLVLFSALSLRIETQGVDLGLTIAALAISALFILSFQLRFLKKILRSKPLIFFGSISYPLYLIHNNAMVSITIKTEAAAPWLHLFLTPYPAIVLLIFTSYLIAYYVEPQLRFFFNFTFKEVGKLWGKVHY